MSNNPSTVSRVMNVLASFGLSCAILIVLLLLTWLGTLYQVEHGLYVAQKKYFESWIVWQPLFGGLSLPLPGGLAAMIALFVNLVAGGIVRLRRTWSRAGILIIHLGMALMLLAGFVKLEFSDDGRMALHESESADWFDSYYEWEIAISRVLGDGQVEEHVVPWSKLAKLHADSVGTFHSDAIPFELRVTGFQRNAVAVRGGSASSLAQPIVDGWSLRPLQRFKQAEANAPGCYATARLAGGREYEGILSGRARYPWAVTTKDATWLIDLRRRRWQLPFRIRLEDFRKEDHPRMELARSYESDVTMIEGDSERPVRIWMNNPLRHEGYILFQSSFDRDERGEISVFSVVRNPSDHWPLYSCIIIALGLVMHFSRRLWRYVRSEQRKLQTQQEGSA